MTEDDIDLEIRTFRLELRTLVSEGELTTHAKWGDTEGNTSTQTGLLCKPGIS